MIPAVADFSGNSALSDNPDGGLRRPHLLQRVWHLCRSLFHGGISDGREMGRTIPATPVRRLFPMQGFLSHESDCAPLDHAGVVTGEWLFPGR